MFTSVVYIHVEMGEGLIDLIFGINLLALMVRYHNERFVGRQIDLNVVRRL